MALGILVEGMARWFGQPLAVTAQTRLGPATRPGPDGPIEADVPDHVVALTEFPDDVTATIEMSARTNGVASDHVTIHGRDGSLIVDLGAKRIDLVTTAGPRRPRAVTSATRTAPAGPRRSISWRDPWRAPGHLDRF